ncbi:MAG: type II toxin-antitoxin system HicB family antitoxin [Desulfobacterales bacterium]|jgi:predicted HicB family RNase H-like nuclease|nr:type II toxin-antitoxin system HicB family antitoxin [Desulfobacterales bacterium]
MASREWGNSMKNIMEIDGYKAVIQYDSENEIFRGEFIELNGGADFYAKDIKGLRKEGKISLKVFLDMCREKGVGPVKKFSGKFNLRIPTQLHAKIATVAAADGKSINVWIVEKLSRMVDKSV